MFKIFDLHNDYFFKLNSDIKKNNYFLKNDEYIDKVITAIWTSELNETESLSAIKRARNYVNKTNKTNLAVEDLHFLNKDNFALFLKYRPVYAGLVWNRTNCIAGGAFESGRLTLFGKNVIKEFEKNDIVIDVAHLNEESFADVLKCSRKPVICSHTAFFGKNEHKRNLKDYQIKEIIQTGGIVGISFVSDFLNATNKSTVSDVVSHIDYFACKFGINNLAIGSDYFGTYHITKNLENYKKLTLKLSSELLKMGYTEKSINKIFCENASNFFGFWSKNAKISHWLQI